MCDMKTGCTHGQSSVSSVIVCNGLEGLGMALYRGIVLGLEGVEIPPPC